MSTFGKSLAALSAMVVATVMLPGCYEEVSTPEPQTTTAPAQPQQGPITDSSFSGGGAALGGAKRSATNITNQAEDASQRVADQADEMNDE